MTTEEARKQLETLIGHFNGLQMWPSSILGHVAEKHGVRSHREFTAFVDAHTDCGKYLTDLLHRVNVPGKPGQKLSFQAGAEVDEFCGRYCEVIGFAQTLAASLHEVLPEELRDHAHSEVIAARNILRDLLMWKRAISPN